MKSRVLFISYFTGVIGNCPAEWADDKINVLKTEKLDTYVLTGMGSCGIDCKIIKYFKTPSIAADDFKYEVSLMQRDTNRSQFTRFAMLPFIFLFGKLVKWLTDKVTRGGSCQWSWVLMAFPTALYIIFTRKIDIIFCTGGPPSAHLVGALVSLFSRAKLVNEFQDPLIGSEIDSSEYKQRVTRFFEKYFIARSQRTIFVTKKASQDAQVRHRNLAKKITFFYPGARDFNFLLSHKAKNSKFKKANSIELLHMGTLYGNRNFDKIFCALDELYVEKKVHSGSLKIVNLGSVYCNGKDEYLMREDFHLIDEMSRLDAIKRASWADILLLAQHSDRRSLETIPYKVYDYLNLELPIFGLINSPELEALLKSSKKGAVIANPLEISEIKEAILKLIKSHKTNQLLAQQEKTPPNIREQFLTSINFEVI